MTAELRLLEQLKEIVRQHSMQALSDLDATTHLIRTGILDSIGVVAVAAGIAKTMRVELRPGDINPENFATLDRMMALVSRTLALKQDTELETR